MKTILHFLCLFFVLTIIAQETPNKQKIDSLLVLVEKTKVDTLKVNLYFEVCKNYRKIDPKKTEFYNVKLFELSQKSNFQRGIAHYYHVKAMAPFYKGNYKEALMNIEVATKKYLSVNDTKNYLGAIYILVHSTWKLGNNSLAKKIILETIKKSEKNKYIEQIASLHYSLGCIYNEESDFNNALQHLEKSLPLYRKLNNSSSVLRCFNEIVIIYTSTNQLDKALYYSNKSIAEATKKDYDSKTYRSILANNANIYIELKDYKKALISANKALTSSKKNDDTGDYHYNMNTIAAIYAKLGSFDKAIQNATIVMKETNNDQTFETCYEILGEVYFNLKKYDKAKFYQEKLITKLLTTNDYFYFGNVFEEIAKTEYALGNFECAFSYQQKYMEIKDQNEKVKNSQKLKELQTKFEVKEKELEYKLLKTEKQKSEFLLQKKNKQVQFQNFFIALFFLAAIIGFYIYNLIKKKNVLLTIKNNEIEAKQTVLEATQEELNASLQTKEVLLKEIHHRVKNNLQLIMSLLNIQAQQQNFTTIEDFMEKSQMRINSLSLIHENLNSNGIYEKVNFQQYVSNLVDNIKKSFLQPANNIHFEIETNQIVLPIDTAIPLGIIINELTTNAIKHAFSGDQNNQVIISLTKKDGRFKLIFQDNGTNKTAQQPNQKSIGLVLVNLLVAQLKGKLTTDNDFKYTIDFQAKS